MPGGHEGEKKASWLLLTHWILCLLRVSLDKRHHPGRTGSYLGGPLAGHSKQGGLATVTAALLPTQLDHCHGLFKGLPWKIAPYSASASKNSTWVPRANAACPLSHLKQQRSTVEPGGFAGGSPPMEPARAAQPRRDNLLEALNPSSGGRCGRHCLSAAPLVFLQSLPPWWNLLSPPRDGWS